MKSIATFISMFRSYRKDGFSISHSIKGAALWSGVLHV